MAAAAVMNMASSLAETRSTASSASVSSTPLRPIHQKMAKLVPFLRKVQQLCENAPSHIARWSADGKQFDVLDPKGFDELLKVHFEGASPATFHRQLFFYGWVKLNHTNGGGDEKTKGTWSFRHPCFLRDEPHKIYEIKRYARASDREEEDGGSRVDILEKRVSALQSLVDDLSRKLAAVQLTLDRSQPQQQQQAEQQSFEPARTTRVEKTRKRVKDDDLEFLADEIRLTEEDLMHLFDDEPALVEAESEPLPAEVIPVSPMVRAQIPAEAEQAPAPMKDKMFTAQQQQKAQELLTSFMATPQFQAALTSKTIQEGSQTVRKVEVPPHLSVC